MSAELSRTRSEESVIEESIQGIQRKQGIRGKPGSLAARTRLNAPRLLTPSYTLYTSCTANPRAHRPDMDMRAGGLPGHRVPEREIGNLLGGQILAQPLAFRLIRVHGHVHPPA